MTRSALHAAVVSHRDQPDDGDKSRASSRRGGDAQRERLTRDVRNRRQQESRLTVPGMASVQANDTMLTMGDLPVVPQLTPEQMYSNFEEWIKMCTDNKVNATNSWNFALIDYFHEMTFIRDGDSINFQKASCTLDGCVKIYTSRVDSVASETGKLLSGLADSTRESSETAEGDDYQEGGSERKQKRRGNRSNDSTLLKDFSSLALKKLDLDFTVDPLFKKTSADFDEGGAKGLLLNHLSVDRNCRICFDASEASAGQDLTLINEDHESLPDEEDATPEDDVSEHDHQDMSIDHDDESNENDPPIVQDSSVDLSEPTEPTEPAVEMEATEPDIVDNVTTAEPNAMDTDAPEQTSSADTPQTSPTDLLDTSSEDKTVALVEVSRLKAKLPPLETLQDLQICPTLQGFAYFSEADDYIPDIFNDHEGSDEKNAALAEAEATTDVLNFDDFNDDLEDDAVLDGGANMDPFMADDDDQADEGEGDDVGIPEPMGIQEEDYIMAMISNEDEELYSYFDNKMEKGWAGPEHWKLRRPMLQDTKDVTVEDEGAKAKRKVKQAFEIDFINGLDINEEELFASDKRAKITLSSAQEAAANNATHLLPDDMHFSSKQLLRLFLRPVITLNAHKKSHSDPAREGPSASMNATGASTGAANVTEPPNDGADPDIQFWANQTFEEPIGDDDTPPTEEPMTEQSMTGFDDTAFFQDSFYDNDNDDADASMLYGDALITNHRLKRTKPLYVNYARTAKRVDVKKLKENLWRVLTRSRNESDHQSHLDTVQGEHRFTDVVEELKKFYSPKVMKDISISFCFICLLHLANEKNLLISSAHISSSPDDDDPDNFVLGGTGNDDDFANESRLGELTIVQNM